MLNDLSRLSQALAQQLSLVSKSTTVPQEELKKWLQTFSPVAGACYSLVKAQPYLKVERSLEVAINQAIELLSKIEDENAADNLHAWMEGYYLNSAEQRIQASLHRLLKTFTGKASGWSKELMKDIIRSGQLPKTSYPETNSIFDGFITETDKLNDYNNHYAPHHGVGAALARACYRVNSQKHDPLPSPAEEGAEDRWRDAYDSLRSLQQLFMDFIRHKGVTS